MAATLSDPLVRLGFPVRTPRRTERSPASAYLREAPAGFGFERLGTAFTNNQGSYVQAPLLQWEAQLQSKDCRSDCLFSSFGLS